MKKEEVDTVENKETEQTQQVENTEATEAQVTENADATEEKKAETAPEAEVDPLEKAQQEIEELKKQALYKQAEFENFRKRTLKEKADLILAGGEKTIVSFLPILDDFERALTDNSDDAVAVRNGMQLQLSGDVISKPYIELTLCTMRDFGAEVEWTGPNSIEVKPLPYHTTPYFIENDWSAASYWYEMLSLADNESEVRLTGLTDGSRQGDSMVRYLFSVLGVRTTFDSTEKGVPTTVTLRRHHITLPRLAYSFISQPDLAQTFVLTCVLKGIPFHFEGLSTLRIKETDRIEALKNELLKIGFVVRSNAANDLIWTGERCRPDVHPVIHTYEDHRMAMAFAPAAHLFPGLRIDNPSVVTKSYPRYWDDLRLAGYLVEER